jgi:Domain of unknown function (DUF4351)
MAQNPFDQLAKQYLEEFLAPIGQVIRNQEIPGEAKFVDVFFAPNPDHPPDPDLGLLGRIIQTTCSLEPFRNAPSRTEIRTCILKLIWLQEAERRTAKQERRKFSDEHLPQLWVLASTVGKPLLRDFGAQADPHWPIGVYRMANALKTTIVAIDQLPVTPDTLWIRLLGKGPTQENAIQEVLALPAKHPRRNSILRLLANWHVRIDLNELQPFSEQETIMALSQAFLEWEQQTQLRGEELGRQEGRQEGEILGEERGQLASLRSLLSILLPQKLGVLPEHLHAVLQTLQVPQLEALTAELLSFSTIEDLEIWLVTRLRSDLQNELTRSGSLTAAIEDQLQNANLTELVAWIESRDPR